MNDCLVKLQSLPKTEEERSKELCQRLEKELEEFKTLGSKQFPCQLWQRISRCNLKIQELTPNYYYEAIKLINHYYFPEEPLYQNILDDDDDASVNSITRRILNNMKDSTSLVAKNDGKLGEVAGVLVLVEVKKEHFSRIMSREDLVHGTAHKKYVNITNYVIGDINLYTLFDCTTFLRIYAICIKPWYRRMGLGIRFFETAIYVAQSLKIPLIVGIFSDSTLQNIAKKIGMFEIKKIKYSDWKDCNGNQIFNKLSHHHTFCALMAMRVPLPAPPPVLSSRSKILEK